MMWPNKIIEKTILSKKKKVVQALREERGAIFVLTALMLPVIFGFMGIAYDVGNVYVHKSRLQNVADAAALAGPGSEHAPARALRGGRPLPPGDDPDAASPERH